MIPCCRLAIIAACMAAFLIPAATAQQTRLPCAPRADVMARLAAEYSERVIFRGIAQTVMMELFWSPTRRSFTVAITRPDRMTCLIMGGESGELVPLPGSMQKSGSEGGRGGA